MQVTPHFSAHGVLILCIASFFVSYAGWRIGEREGDERGILGAALGLATLVAGLLWMANV